MIIPDSGLVALQKLVTLNLWGLFKALLWTVYNLTRHVYYLGTGAI